jgi:hypothetical protein
VTVVVSLAISHAISHAISPTLYPLIDSSALLPSQSFPMLAAGTVVRNTSGLFICKKEVKKHEITWVASYVAESWTRSSAHRAFVFRNHLREILLNPNWPKLSMTDPLSISASVAGLLSLVIQVADGTYQYVSSARNAPSAVAALLKELQALKTVLVKLDDLTHNSHSWQAVPNRDFAVVSLLDIESCTAEIEKIQRKLGSLLDVRGRMKVVQHLIWPFLEDKTMQMAKTLHSYVDIFHLALSIDSLWVFNVSVCSVVLLILS